MSTLSEDKRTNDNENNNNNKNINLLIQEEILRLGNGSTWLWKIFFLCMTPGILNGLHISSYVFIGQMPDSYWCVIPELKASNWTEQEIINISTNFNTLDSCKIYNYNYHEISERSYEEALIYIQTLPLPSTVSCTFNDNNHFNYNQTEGVSIVPEWNLICDNIVWRSTVQVALSIGKFFGAFLFGILSDKYGRKFSVNISAIIYIISGPISVFVPWYAGFLLARIGLGFAGSGVYHSAYTILTEVASPKKRSWMSIVYSISYPIGMLLLVLAAYFIHNWRYLQLTLSLPAIFLIIHFYFLVESPRWLLSKDRISDAYKIVFNKTLPKEIKLRNSNNIIVNENNAGIIIIFLKESLKEIISLYGKKEIRNKLLICHFQWFVATLSYYAIALNADNFSANRYIYVALTGLFEAPSYILPIFLLKKFGRRYTSIILFLTAGISLLILLAIPQSLSGLTIGIAMFGRLCISAVYAVVILHTAELFPTEIRNSAIGTSSTMSHIGSISAPYIVDLLGSIAWYIPTTICGTVAVVAGCLTFLLPETQDKELHIVDNFVS